jgi:hypothetical protein
VIRTIVLSDFVPEALLIAAHPDVIDRVLYDLASGARDFWLKRAGEKLHTTLRDYVDGIQEVEVEPGRVTVALVGALANMIEDGAQPYDMHDTLLGPSVPLAGPGQRGKRVNKAGQFYRSIPFRHQVPGTLGKGGGAVMGSQYFRNSPMAKQLQAELGKAIHKAAKKLAPTSGMPGAPTSWGGRLPPGVAGVSKLKPHHTTDIYAGMVRQVKTYGKATQATYTTFRTISDAVPGKWLHPGIGAVNLADEVQKHVEAIAGDAFMAALGSAL